MGLPAYWNAGRIKIQNEAVQAAATPVGPHLSPRKNNGAVTAILRIVHRKSRPVVPRERWIIVTDLYISRIPMSGVKNVKIEPAASHLGSRMILTTFRPINVIAPATSMPTIATDERPLRKYLRY